MDMRSGYKQSEFGVIPEEWNASKLGLYAKFRTGPFGSSLHKSDYIDGGIPLINPMHINDGKLTPQDKVSVRKDAAKRLSEFTLVQGDIVIGRRGEMGRCAVVPKESDGWLCGTGSMIIRLEKTMCPQFLQRVLSSPSAIDRLEEASVGSTMINLNQEVLSKLAILVPPKYEQRTIAEALSDVDDLIAGLDRLIAKKRDIKQATMQQLLTGGTRLPGFSGEWEVRRLGEIGEAIIGLTYKPTDVVKDGLLVLRSSNIQDGALCFDDNVFVNVAVPERIKVKQGDILICVRNGSRVLIGKCAKITSEVEGMTFGAFMSVFRTPLHPFVHHQFQSDIVKRQIHGHLGATINQITNKSLNSFEIPLPLDKGEQAAIADVLSDMDAELSALEAKRNKTRDLKQGMMQELLTGKTRLV